MSEKGTRLPKDWRLPEEWRLWAMQKRPDLDISESADEFRDYWISKSGAGATKLDWFATWRNWVRKAYVRRPISMTFQQMAHRQAAERISQFAPRVADLPHSTSIVIEANPNGYFD